MPEFRGLLRFLDPALVAHLTSRRTLVWATVLSSVALTLTFAPLLGSLGFEFAFVIGLFASVAAADLGAAFVRRARDPQTHPVERRARRGRLVFWLWARAALVALALLVPPLVIVSANALRVRQCDWVQGSTFYVLLPGLSVLYATAAGVASGLLFWSRPRLGVAAAWLVVLGSIALGVARFYFGPPVFAYDPFAGYFPGTLYDEHVELGAPFFWARLYQAALATVALAACASLLDPDTLGVRRKAGLAWRPLAVALAAGTVGAALGLNADRLGFAASADDIARALGGRLETEHFVIHYPKGAPFAAYIDAIGREHEFRYAQVERVFGTAPNGKIRSFYFASADEKRRWMGAQQTEMAKPWRREIYLQHDAFPHDSLRHEIAHVFAGTFGDPVFRVSVKWLGWPPVWFNVGLIEGAAVAADWPTRASMTPHQAVRAMLDRGRLPPIARILQPGFFRFSAAQSYTAAGSFVRFLIDRYGPEKFRAFYRSGGTPADAVRIYGRPLEALEHEWHDEVRRTPLGEDDRAVAEERFRRPGILGRPCPRAVARRLVRAQALLGHGDAEGAIQVLDRICRDDPDEPGHRLTLAAALERAGRLDEAAALARTIGETDDLPPPLRVRALLFLGDLLARRGDLSGARAAVERALALPCDEAQRRNLLVRRRALADGAPGSAELRDYLVARGPDGREPDPVVLVARAQEVARALPESGLGPYLEGRVLFSREAWADAARALARAHAIGLDEPLVRRENDRLLVTAAFLAGDLSTAAAAAERLAAPDQPAQVRNEGADWRERIAYAKEQAAR